MYVSNTLKLDRSRQGDEEKEAERVRGGGRNMNRYPGIALLSSALP
jgi:hypothetical protein